LFIQLKSICNLGGSIYFYGPSIIVLKGNFRKKDCINLKADLLRTPKEYKNYEINELSKIITQLQITNNKRKNFISRLFNK